MDLLEVNERVLNQNSLEEVTEIQPYHFLIKDVEGNFITSLNGKLLIEDLSTNIIHCVADTPSVRQYFAQIEQENRTQQENTEASAGSSRTGRVVWSHAATLLLFSLWTNVRPLFENNIQRNEPLWEDISNKLRNEGLVH